MAVVRPTIKMEERTTTKILNLYSKSVDPSNKTGSLVVTTTIPGGTTGVLDGDGGDFDASEITVIFEDEIETLYVGPVEISEEEQYKMMQEEAAAAAAKEKEAAMAAVRGTRGGVPKKGISLLLNSNASSSSGAGQSSKDNNNGATAAAKQLSPAEATESTSNGGSDSGIDNCLRDVVDNNKNRKNIGSSPTNKDLKQPAQKRVQEQQKPVQMAIKKRGRPPGSGVAGQQAQKSPKLSTTTTGEVKKTSSTTVVVKKDPAATTSTPAAAKSAAMASPSRPQYECELCEEVFSRVDTIMDHYQSYHRVDPKKRMILPRVIPKAAEEAVDDAVLEEQQKLEVTDELQDMFVEVELPVATTAAGRKKLEAHSTTTTQKAPKSQGLICGKCNLTFRSILLLSRHVKEMHERPAVEEDEEEGEEEEEEEVASDDDPDYKQEPEEEDEEKQKKKTARQRQQSVLKSSLVRVKKEKENESPPERPKRGRPRKSEATPRILNADKNLNRVRMERGPDGDQREDEEQQEKPRRGRKRKQFAGTDADMVVVPAAVKAKRAMVSRTRNSSTVQVKDPLAMDSVIYVEVIDEKDGVVYEGVESDSLVEEEEEAEADSTTVYKIKEMARNSASTDKDGQVKYPCPLCDMTFTRRYSLEPHIQRVHHKMRTKECEYCGRKFQATGDLTRHMTIHTGEKPFECSLPGCPFRFVSRSDLAKHELRHTAGVPRTYVCGTCDKSFERPYDLRRHQTTHKEMQVDFRSYKCDQCHREFTRRDEYRAHMYRHLGVKPLKCHVCGKPFVDMSNCAKHAKGHGPLTHDGPEDPKECGDCGQRFTNQTAMGRHLTRCWIERSAVPVHTVPQFEYFDEDVK